MTLLIPIGARIFVKDIEATVSLEERAKASGLHIVLHEENIPKPTEGRVVAVGSDPLIQSLVQTGDRVIFSRHSGTHIQVNGEEFRNLEINEIISVIRESAVPEESSSDPTVAPSPPDTQR